MHISMRCGSVVALCALFTIQVEVKGTVDVYLNFGDTWKSELDFATNLAGIDAFSEVEKGRILEAAVMELGRIYSGYEIDFRLTDPGGDRHMITYAEPHPGDGLGAYGSTNVNAVGGYASSATAKVFPKNFSSIISGLSPANRIQGLGMELGSVGAHELGHIFGLNHQHIYANPGITPANYLDTGALHRQHVMSVPIAPYGSQKNFNPFERAILDIVGGTVLGGTPVVSNPVSEVVEVADAGNSAGTATALQFSLGESSQQQITMQRGDLDGSSDDVDVYSFTTTSTGLLSVNLFSERSYYGDSGLEFNGRIRLLAADGVTVLADFDDLYYEDTVYNQSTYVDQGGFTINVRKVSDDPFMVNVPLNELGTYYLEVFSMGNAQAGDVYQMLATYSGDVVPVPEPASVALAGILGGGLLAMRRRSRA